MEMQYNIGGTPVKRPTITVTGRLRFAKTSRIDAVNNERWLTSGKWRLCFLMACFLYISLFSVFTPQQTYSTGQHSSCLLAGNANRWRKKKPKKLTDESWGQSFVQNQGSLVLIWVQFDCDFFTFIFTYSYFSVIGICLNLSAIFKRNGRICDLFDTFWF